MAGMLGNQSVTGVKAAVKKLYLNSRIKKQQVHFIKKLMQTKAGKLLESIRIWKDLPEKNQMSKIRNAQKFFGKLRSLADKCMVRSFAPFVEEMEEGELKKRRAMGILINMSSSDIRKFYIKWHGDTKKLRIIN